MEKRIQRNNSMDILRVIACMAVVIIHVSTAPVGSAAAPVSGGILKNLELIHILMQWSVPVFFMITGFCMMQKENCTYSYCFSKVLKYAATLFTVGLFYALLEGVFTEKTINLKIIFNAFKSVIGGYTWEHMWFVYSIIGVYLVMPIIHCFMKQGNKNIMILTTLLLFFSILTPAMNKYLPIGIELPFDGYLVYVCYGGMIAKCSWGIYLIHPFFMNIALKVLKIDLLSGMLYVKLLIFAIVLFVISMITTYILRKIPVIKKIF